MVLCNEGDKISNGALGKGFATLDQHGRVIETRYIEMSRCDLPESGTRRMDESYVSQEFGQNWVGVVGHDPRRHVDILAVETKIRDLKEEAIDLSDVYLRLHLLSARLATPDEVNLHGMFDFIVTVAWTSIGPCLPEFAEELQSNARINGTGHTIEGIWPLPKMTDYVAPTHVKIMKCENVRLGAYLAPGTVVHGAGYCNFGSATLGPTVIEGRLSLGVVIGAGTHIGGGASLMGTTSGGGTTVVSVGENCLVGANAGLGIALGDDCIVESGCYVTAGMPVTLPNGKIVKAIELSGRSQLLFRRNAVGGNVEALPSPGWKGLNPILHQP